MSYTNEEILAAARAAVQEKGADYVYPDYGQGCTYATPESEPSCIVGNIVNRLDPEKFKLLVEIEEAKGTFAAGALNRRIDLGISEWQTLALGGAQEIQDGGKPWGRALEHIERYLSGYADEVDA